MWDCAGWELRVGKQGTARVRARDAPTRGSVTWVRSGDTATEYSHRALSLDTATGYRHRVSTQGTTMGYCHGVPTWVSATDKWVNVKSRLIKLVLLPLWYGNKDIIRDTLS